MLRIFNCIIFRNEKVVAVKEVETPVRFWCQIAKATVAQNLSTASEELQLYCRTGLKVAGNSHQKNKVRDYQNNSQCS